MVRVLPCAVGVSYAGKATIEDSWFPGFDQRFAYCVKCRAHLGWGYFAPTLLRCTPTQDYGEQQEDETISAPPKRSFLRSFFSKWIKHESEWQRKPAFLGLLLAELMCLKS